MNPLLALTIPAVFFLVPIGSIMMLAAAGRLGLVTPAQTVWFSPILSAFTFCGLAIKNIGDFLSDVFGLVYGISYEDSVVRTCSQLGALGVMAGAIVLSVAAAATAPLYRHQSYCKWFAWAIFLNLPGVLYLLVFQKNRKSGLGQYLAP